MSATDDVNIPGYRIVSRIMAGGMATVYVAEQLKLGSRRVAIKIFRSHTSDHDTADHVEARQKRFAQEAMIARNLQHPHVVQIFDYGSTDDFQFLVMEYLAHGDLKQRIREGLQPQQVLCIMQQIASALALLHQTGVVHRDIKPANILFREPDHAVLADFGIARSIDQNTQLTNIGFVLGTPSYMSPEQINGGSITARTDMYALGVLFHEMLTGNLPYRGDSVQSVATQHLMAPVPPLPLEVRRLQPLLNRLMAKKPQERIASGSELLQALSQIDSSRGFAVKPPSFAQLHSRKMVAIAGLMSCSVAITWAGVSQLPHWLNDAEPLTDSVMREDIMTPAPGDDSRQTVSQTPLAVQQEAILEAVPPQIVSAPKSVPPEQPVAGNSADTPAPSNNNSKNGGSKTIKSATTAAVHNKPAAAAADLLHDDAPIIPDSTAIAEPRAAYDVVVTDVAASEVVAGDVVQHAQARPDAESPPSAAVSEAPAPGAPAAASKAKSPPVVSFF